MAKYITIRNEDGSRTLEAVDIREPVTVPKPAGVTMPGGKMEIIECTACEVQRAGNPRKFKTKAIMANHFKKSHADLYKDKNSWRLYVRVLKVE